MSPGWKWQFDTDKNIAAMEKPSVKNPCTDTYICSLCLIKESDTDNNIAVWVNSNFWTLGPQRYTWWAKYRLHTLIHDINTSQLPPTALRFPSATSLFSFLSTNKHLKFTRKFQVFFLMVPNSILIQ